MKKEHNMMDIFGPFLLILIVEHGGSGVDMEVREMKTFEDCQVVKTQLEPIRKIRAYCVAAQTRKD